MVKIQKKFSELEISEAKSRVSHFVIPSKKQFGLKKPQPFYISLYNCMYKGIHENTPLSQPEDRAYGRVSAQESFNFVNTGEAEKETGHTGNAPNIERDSEISGRERKNS